MSSNSKIFIACCILCLVSLQASVQANDGISKTDSLEKEFDPGKPVEENVKILLQLSQENLTVNQPRALSWALKAYQLAEDSDYEPGMVQAMLKLAWLYYTETDYARALDYAARAEELAGKLGMQAEIALAYDAMGAVYDDFGDRDKSSEYFFKSLRIFEKLNDKAGMAEASSRIGLLYYNQKNYPKALEYLNASLEFARASNRQDGIASNLNSIAGIYSDQGDFQGAMQKYREALAIAENTGDLRREGSICKNMGATCVKMKDYSQSLQYINRALRIFEKLNNHLRITRCQVQLGEFYMATNDFRQAIVYGLMALHESENQGFKDVALDAAILLHRLYLSAGDTLKAYQYAILEGKLKDSLNDGEKQKTLTKLDIQYQFDKEQSKRAIAQQRKDYITVIFIILLLSVVIILVLIWGRQKVKARNAVLQKENLEKELEFKNKEMVLNVMSLMKKNEMLSDLSEKLIRIEGEATTAEGKDTIKKVARELQKGQEEEIWKEFSLRFKEVHGEFYDKLLKKYPALSPNELKLCAFLRLNMSSKDIAALTGQRTSSLETARYRLRQKLGISNADVNLITFLSQI